MITRFPLVSLNLDPIPAGMTIRKMPTSIVRINLAEHRSCGLREWS